MKSFFITKYNTLEYNFIGLVEDLFGVNSLEHLHILKHPDYNNLFEVGKDSSTVFHQKFYDKYREGWDELVTVYERFIQEQIFCAYIEDFLYQKFPTFRVHLPGNIAVGAFHNDAEFHHPAGEINFIIPLTNSNDSASVWVESEPSKKDFAPITLNQGELVMFDGNRLTHGNRVNVTGRTRVSMDFRILPISKYDESNSGESMTLSTKFREGEYYKRFKK